MNPSPLSLGLALALLAAAGLSDTLGQTVVLLLNRVPVARFLLCLARGVLITVAAAGCWTGSLWLAGAFWGWSLPLGRCFWLVALAHAPLLLGFATLLPYFGLLLFHALRAAVFWQLVVTLGLFTGASLPLCLLVCLPGYALHFVLTHGKLLALVSRP